MNLTPAVYRRIATLAGALALVMATAGIMLLHGGYNVAATTPHTAPVFALLDYASRRSIAVRARFVVVPPVPADVALGRGLAIYRDHCVQCHGAPGIAPAPFALGLSPAAANLALVARDRKPAEVYWTVRYGLKMTAMPAWDFRFSEADLWAVTAFVGYLAELSPDAYRDVAARVPAPHPTTLSADPGKSQPDPRRGEMALHQYACTTCHEIPGIVGADHPVGPSLAGIAVRRYIAGTLPNTPANLVAWIRSPGTIKPGTAMPDLQVSERDATDVAAFLSGLR